MKEEEAGCKLGPGDQGSPSLGGRVPEYPEYDGGAKVKQINQNRLPGSSRADINSGTWPGIRSAESRYRLAEPGMNMVKDHQTRNAKNNEKKGDADSSNHLISQKRINLEFRKSE